MLIMNKLILQHSDFIIFWIWFFNSHGRKPRSNYRRPSSLGLSVTPLTAKSEAKSEYKPMASGRSHIVAPLQDHLRPEGSFEAVTEANASYRNLSPMRPVIHKLKDTLKVFARKINIFTVSYLLQKKKELPMYTHAREWWTINLE